MDKALRLIMDEAGPRNAPLPTSPCKIPISSSVPDVSLIFSSKGPPTQSQMSSLAGQIFEKAILDPLPMYGNEGSRPWRREPIRGMGEYPTTISRSGKSSGQYDGGTYERDRYYDRNSSQEGVIKRTGVEEQIAKPLTDRNSTDSPVVVDKSKGALQDSYCAEGRRKFGRNKESSRRNVVIESHLSGSLIKTKKDHSCFRSEAFSAQEFLVDQNYNDYGDNLRDRNVQNVVHTTNQIPCEEILPCKRYVPCNSSLQHEYFGSGSPHPKASSDNCPHESCIQQSVPSPTIPNADIITLFGMISTTQDQCSTLSKLFERMVAVQSDQTKLLKEINLKLSASTEQEPCENMTCVPSYADKCTQTSPYIENVNQRDEFIHRGKTSEDVCVHRNTVTSDKKFTREDNQTAPNTKGCQCRCDKECTRGDNREPLNTKGHQGSSRKSSVHSKAREESLTLHDVHVPTIIGPPPSFVSTMHLHMQDYQHSSASLFDDEAESGVEDDNAMVEGVQSGNWTLYDNIVGHVKKFLQPIPSHEESSVEGSQSIPTVEAIRIATLERIRQLGVRVYDNSTEFKEVSTKRVQFGAVFRPDSQPLESAGVSMKSGGDTSVGIQSLAMKYLQDDELCELAEGDDYRKSPVFKTSPRSTNMSLSTRNYLEKYHLLPHDDVPFDESNGILVDPNPASSSPGDNILDITALKKQPKLL